MLVIKSIASLRKTLQKIRQRKKRIGFVPTMGALHEGHLSLIRVCRRENDLTLLSIFINPTQFGPHEDFNKYPRAFKKDSSLAKKEGVDIIFHPSVDEMYSRNHLTFVETRGITDILCGRFRPGHFRGVTTVVSKLLNIVEPDSMYLGQKDAQQVAVLKKMISDLNFSVAVKICPTVREKNGLAMSSRNQYLTPKQREEASILYRTLKTAKTKILQGEKNISSLLKSMHQQITEHSSLKVEYIECVHPQTFERIHSIKGRVMLALAGRLDKTRLIDNIVLNIK